MTELMGIEWGGKGGEWHGGHSVLVMVLELRQLPGGNMSACSKSAIPTRVMHCCFQKPLHIIRVPHSKQEHPVSRLLHYAHAYLSVAPPTHARAHGRTEWWSEHSVVAAHADSRIKIL
jgi:hypothetical protein